jgi:hypothetical protein
LDFDAVCGRVGIVLVLVLVVEDGEEIVSPPHAGLGSSVGIMIDTMNVVVGLKSNVGILIDTGNVVVGAKSRVGIVNDDRDVLIVVVDSMDIFATTLLLY